MLAEAVEAVRVVGGGSIGEEDRAAPAEKLKVSP